MRSGVTRKETGKLHRRIRRYKLLHPDYSAAKIKKVLKLEISRQAIADILNGGKDGDKTV